MIGAGDGAPGLGDLLMAAGMVGLRGLDRALGLGSGLPTLEKNGDVQCPILPERQSTG